MRELQKISKLEVGVFRGDIIVRVERIVRVQRVSHPLGPHRPMIEQEGVHIVVFDDSVSVFLVLFRRFFFIFEQFIFLKMLISFFF